MGLLWQCLFLVMFAGICNCARILGVFLAASYSHQIVFQPIYKELSLRGHEVIVLTPNPLNDPTLTNLTEIDFSFVYKYNNQIHNLDPNDFVKSRKICYEYMDKTIIDMLEDERFKRIYQDPNQKFDLVFVEGFSVLTQVFGYKFNAPEIPVFSLEGTFEIHTLIGNPYHPAIYGATFLEFEYPISIWEKLKNSYYFLWNKWYYNYVVRSRADEIAKKYFGADFPPVASLEKNLSVVFVNKNKFMGPVRPLAPGAIQMEFMHLKPSKPLPKDLEEILNNSTEGVVYFSLGSNVKSSGLPATITRGIIEGLSALPYTVLWKWESDQVPDVGKNVFTRKWLPQQDILAHPNVKVFVMQGGLQSIEEAISTTVPMVGIPVIGDQVSNVNRLVKLGVGVHLPLLEITKESLKNAITEVAENSKFSKKLKEIRDLSFDEPMTGLERAVWWSEYVIRHKGTSHLKSALAEVPLYEYLMLDVIAAVLGILSVSIFVIRILCYRIVGSFDTKNKIHKKLL